MIPTLGIVAVAIGATCITGPGTFPRECYLCLTAFAQFQRRVLTRRRVDTIIFGLILSTLWSMTGPRRWLTLGLFLMSMGATGWLFASHATDALHLNF